MSILQLKVVFLKEILDARRDAKSLLSAFFMPVLFAVMMLGSLHFIVAMESQSRGFTIAVIGAQNAIPIVTALQEQGLQIDDYEGDPVEAVKLKDYAVVLEIPAEFNEEFRSIRPAELNIYADHSETKSQIQVATLKNHLTHWSSSIGALRLLVRQVSPEVMSPIRVNDINLASPEQIAAKLLSGLPLIILLLAFVSGIGMSVDMAAGEKERRTLEPLMINPISYSLLFFGKWLASYAVTFAIVILGIALQFLVLYLAPLSELGLRIDLSLLDFILILLVLVPVMFMATAIQLFVSLVSRSFKDAQTYNSLVMLLPMIPGFYLIFNSTAATPLQMLIPILGPQMLLMDIFSGESITVYMFILSAITSLGCALLISKAAVWQLKRESILN